MANLLCLASMSTSAACPAGCDALREHPNQGNAGSPSCAIIAKPSQLWTSSQCRPSLSACSTSFSLLATIGGAFYTSTLQVIRPVPGSCSSYEKPFHTKWGPG